LYLLWSAAFYKKAAFLFRIIRHNTFLPSAPFTSVKKQSQTAQGCSGFGTALSSLTDIKFVASEKPRERSALYVRLFTD
jgi:hypothetical protein